MTKDIPVRPRGSTVPRTVIVEAILRCEAISNPAVIEKDTFSVHVRKLPASDGRGWIVRVIDKASFGTS